MRSHYKWAILFLTITGLIWLDGWCPIMGNRIAPSPSTIILEGTQYINCGPVKGYPFQTSDKIEILDGTAILETGSKSSFWIGLSINDKILFTANDQKLLYGQNLVGKTLKIYGYPGTGKIVIPDFITKEDRTKIFDNAFFVTRISGWIYMKGYPVNENTDEAASEPSYFWINKVIEER